MHLEHKTGSPYQEKLIPSEAGKKIGLKNYEKVHDCLISLPVSENMSKAQLQMVVNTFQRILSESYEHSD